MTQPDFDWTFDDAPLEGEARPGGGGPASQRPGLIPPARRARKPWPRWAWLALAGLAVSALLVAYGVTRVGWRRIEAQIAAEVAYDDARSRAREVNAVLAAQVTDDAYWRAQRTAEVRLGLPAPLPAGNLLPTAYPAQVIAVESLGGSLFAATVRRRYADSAGQVYSFDLVQRYYNLAPGEWQRLATDFSGLVAATLVQGVWLSATVPTSDLPWLKPALVEADAVLTAACAAWQTCPIGAPLSLAFNVGPEALNPSAPQRLGGAAPVAYPLIFDLSSSAPGFPPRFFLSAPQVAGRPADAEAQAVYNRALSVKLLGYMAGVIAQSGRGSSDYFLDALVARMEVQLGLSAPAAAPLSPLAWLPADVLWSLPVARASSAAPADLDDRRQVFALMNMVLAGQPPVVDGTLLLSVHRTPDVQPFEDWLAMALLPGEVAEAVARWTTTAQQRLGQTAPDWSAAEGLALICADKLSIVTQGALRPVAPAFTPPAFYAATLTRSGGAARYLAANFTRLQVTEQTFTHLELWVFDREAGAPPVRVSENGYAVGWGADDALYYLPLDAPTSDTGGHTGYSLARYDPVSGQTTTAAQNLFFAFEAAWSVDRRSLLFTEETQNARTGVVTTRPMLLTLGPPAALRALAERGYAPAFAPGSTAVQGQAAYLLGVIGEPGPRVELHVLDLAGGGERVLLDSAPAGAETISDGMQLIWSPGGAWLAFAGFGASGPRLRLVAVTRTGQAVPVPVATGSASIPLGFSADDAYLAAQDIHGGPFVLLDLNAAGSAPSRVLNGNSLAWAPAGHTLAFSNALGVFLVDAATGAYQWLQAEPCDLDW